jgi:hypothetical protein
MKTFITIDEKMFQMGWEDAVNGNSPRFSTKNYMAGYSEGKKDIGEEND